MREYGVRRYVLRFVADQVEYLHEQRGHGNLFGVRNVRYLRVDHDRDGVRGERDVPDLRHRLQGDRQGTLRIV